MNSGSRSATALVFAGADFFAAVRINDRVVEGSLGRAVTEGHEHADRVVIILNRIP